MSVIVRPCQIWAWILSRSMVLSHGVRGRNDAARFRLYSRRFAKAERMLRSWLVIIGATLSCAVVQGCGSPSQQPSTPERQVPANTADLAEGPLTAEWRATSERLMSKAYVPDAKSVDEMIAESYGHPLSPIARDIGPFVVPRTEYENILKHFRASEIDRSAWPDDREMGTVRLVLSGGTTIRYCWFWLGKKNRLGFSYGGVRYISVGERFADDETLALDAVVREIHERATAGKQPNSDE